MSPVNGTYNWPQTVAGGAVTQPCVLGAAVDEGQARRQCGDDAVWRQPDFTQCINSECFLCFFFAYKKHHSVIIVHEQMKQTVSVCFFNIQGGSSSCLAISYGLPSWHGYEP